MALPQRSGTRPGVRPNPKKDAAAKRKNKPGWTPLHAAFRQEWIGGKKVFIPNV